MTPTFDKRRLVIAIGLGIGMLLIFGTIVMLINSVTTNNINTSHVPIKNYSGTVKNLSKDYEDKITSQLLFAIKYNTPNIKRDDIKDAVIRDGSVSQDAVKKGVQYSGSFIVDIASIKQSYLVEYAYSNNPDDGFMAGYPIVVSCLDKSKLIYGDFSCKDAFNSVPVADPIIADLPYSTLDYSISATTNRDGEVSLDVKFSLSSVDYQTGLDKVIAKRKQDVRNWIVSKGSNPDNYAITYSS